MSCTVMLMPKGFSVVGQLPAGPSSRVRMRFSQILAAQTLSCLLFVCSTKVDRTCVEASEGLSKFPVYKGM
ncbi:hypothetical protein DNTS_024316 [Danionella cerebrum]|uniref:Uncharacterized protein n=1 Tax=Danionella cerebrum TaxID=2873325 RepID=A0A553NLQ3_9TELE|nr:hypothetical protein DNTS_024316 [Danionella translucida]